VSGITDTTLAMSRIRDIAKSNKVGLNKLMSDKVKIERVKGSGPGGQHRNKRETGIRLTDLETGLKATSNMRSQAQNLKAAFKDLERKIAAKKKKKKKRIKTKASRASKERRIQAKKNRSSIKKNRSRHFED
jgi:ribosome-associated protein